MNNTQIGFAVALLLLMALAGIFLRTPDDPRCSYHGGSPLWKIVLGVTGATIAFALLAAVV